MDNEIQKFNNPEFGDVRIVMKEGMAWFVAADVCRVLELADVSSAVRKLDEDEKVRIICRPLAVNKQC